MSGELTYDGHVSRTRLLEAACALHMCSKKTRMFGVKLSVLLGAAIFALCLMEYLHNGASEWAWGGGAFLGKIVELAGEALAEVTE